MKLGPHNEQAVTNLLAVVMATAGEAFTGIDRMKAARAAAQQPNIVVPKTNGSQATFKDPRQEQERAVRVFMGQVQRGLTGLIASVGALQEAMNEPEKALKIAE